MKQYLNLAIIVLIGSLSFTTSVYATPITYDYYATVTNCPLGNPAGPCGTSGNPGPVTTDTIISGYILFDADAVASGNAEAGDVLDFFFDVGGVFLLTSMDQTVDLVTNLLFDTNGQVSGGIFGLNLPDLAGPGIAGLLIDTYGPGGLGEWAITVPDFGNAFVVGGNSQLTQVPEPSTLLLILVGLLGISHMRYRTIKLQ